MLNFKKISFLALVFALAFMFGINKTNASSNSLIVSSGYSNSSINFNALYTYYSGQTEIELNRMSLTAPVSNSEPVQTGSMTFHSSIANPYIKNFKIKDLSNNQILASINSFNANVVDVIVDLVISPGETKNLILIGDVNSGVPANTQFTVDMIHPNNLPAQAYNSKSPVNVSGKTFSRRIMINPYPVITQLENVITKDKIEINWKTESGNDDCTVIYSNKDSNLDDDTLVPGRDPEDYIFGSIFAASDGPYYNLTLRNQGSEAKFFQGKKAYYKIICYNRNRDRSVSPVYSFDLVGDSNYELPDLTVNNISFTSSSMNEAGILSVTIKNLGGDLNSATGLMNWYNNFSAQNFIFTNSSNPTISSFTTSRSIPSLSNPLGKNEIITFYWNGKFNTHGNLYLHFTVNNNKELEESNYNNNTFTTGIRINQTTSNNQITNINQTSQSLAQGNVNELLSQINQLRNQVREQETQIRYLQNLTTELSRISANMQIAINTFVTYGVDDNTKRLGEGERAAVVNSYKSAYGKLPNSEEELSDIIKIANGRWPSTTNFSAENRALAEFKNIYKREANMNNANDNAAVTIMAYGLRQRAENRNLNSESAGLKIFKGIYNRLPQSTNDWNILQAITYSGATR